MKKSIFHWETRKRILSMIMHKCMCEELGKCPFLSKHYLCATFHRLFHIKINKWFFAHFKTPAGLNSIYNKRRGE